jgi:hypothetical protein
MPDNEAPGKCSANTETSRRRLRTTCNCGSKSRVCTRTKSKSPANKNIRFLGNWAGDAALRRSAWCPLQLCEQIQVASLTYSTRAAQLAGSIPARLRRQGSQLNTGRHGPLYVPRSCAACARFCFPGYCGEQLGELLGDHSQGLSRGTRFIGRGDFKRFYNRSCFTAIFHP